MELLVKERDFRLTLEERLLLRNIRSGGGIPVCKVDREAKMVYPTDVSLMNTSEMPEGYSLVNELVWVRTASGEDLLFPGSGNYSLIERKDLFGSCGEKNMSKKRVFYIIDDEDPKNVYMVRRVVMSDDDCVEVVTKFDQRFPVYGLKDGRLTRVIYQSEWLTGEDLAIWKIGIGNVIWSPMAKLLFHL